MHSTTKSQQSPTQQPSPQNPKSHHFLSPTVLKLGLVSFFADIASEMLYPITPIFLTTVLGTSMLSVGLIEGLAESIASLMKTYSGTWSDSISKRKPFIIAGYFLGAIAKPFIGLSQSWTHVLFARAVDRTGKGLRSAPRDALIADSVPEDQRGRAFGWHRGMDTLGAAIGPLLAILFLYYYPDNLRSLYFWALIPGLIAVLILFSVCESEKTPPRPLSRNSFNPLQSWKLFPADFKKYLLAWGVFSIANSSDAFLILKTKSQGVSLTTTILLYCFYNLIYALSSPYLGKLSDKIGRKKIMILGFGIFSAVYLGFGYATELWHFWFLFSIYGLYMGATDGVSKAFCVDLSPKHLKATGIGLLGTVTGLCTVVASVWAGFLWDHYGAQWTFLFAAAGALLAVLIFSTVQEKTYNFN